MNHQGLLQLNKLVMSLVFWPYYTQYEEEII